MHMARWKSWAMHTLWRLHFTFWQGSFVVSRAAGHTSRAQVSWESVFLRLHHRDRWPLEPLLSSEAPVHSS